MRDNRHLLDELEISKLPVAYAWAMDSKDIELLMSVFAEGVEYDVSSLGFPPIVGKEAVRQFYLTQVFPREEASFSSISNIRIELRGDTAIGGDYFMHYGYHSTGSALPTITFGQHLYEFAKENGEWKIKSMKGRLTYQSAEAMNDSSGSGSRS